MNTMRPPPPEQTEEQVLAFHTALRAASRFRSPVIGALLILAILLGKAIVCRHAPDRALFFDAMLMVPISILAYHEGLATGLVAGILATAVDVVIGAQSSDRLIPAYLAAGGVKTAVIARLFTLEVLATIVAVLSYRARQKTKQANRKTERHLKRIYLLEKHSEAIARDARDKQAQFEKRLLRYSSLVYLLEESVQKISSNLETKHLFESLFRVLEECFGSTCASVYLKDPRSRSYFLASAFGAEDNASDRVPMMLRPDEFEVTELERLCTATRWEEPHQVEAFAQAGRRPPSVISGSLVDKGEVVGIIHIHAVDRPGKPDIVLMGMVCNIASIALANARLFGKVQWMADRDPLTALYNRRAFHDRLEKEVVMRAAESEPLALLMLDIDHFKSFNDTYGHQAGDAVLEWFARHCEDCAGDGNTVFRFGGEEFTVIVPGADVHAAQALAERLRQRIEQATFTYGGIDLKVTLSCGVAVFPQNSANAEELVRKADRAMYRAKGAGRNAVAVSDANSGHDSAIVPYEVRVAATVHTDTAAPEQEQKAEDGPPRHHGPRRAVL